jgi:hypothetical protein
MGPFGKFLILGLTSIGIGFATAFHARRQRLSMRYTVGWLILAMVGLAAAVLVPLVTPVARLLSLSPGVVVSGVAVAILIALALQLSVSVSGALRQAEVLALKMALAQAPNSTLLSSETIVVIPAWNEVSSVADVVTPLVHQGHTVVVVDDGSTDGTARRAAEAGALVVSLPFNLGVGAAVRCGLTYALAVGAQRVVQCDADGQHPVESVGALLNLASTSGADLVIGSRFTNGDAPQMTLTRSRRFAMRVLARMASMATGSSLTDATSGFRVINQPLLSELASRMPSYYLGDTFETYVAAGRAGYKVVELHTPIGERLEGSSSASVTSSILMLVKAIFLVTTRLGIHLHSRPTMSR